MNRPTLPFLLLAAALLLTLAAPVSATPLTPLGKIAGGIARDVVHHGGYAYVAAEDLLVIYDVRNPLAPTWVQSLSIDAGEVRAVDVEWGRLYVAIDAPGVLIYDLAAPAHPLPLGLVPTTGPAVGLIAGGWRLYVAEGTAGLEVYEVSDPTSPQLADSWSAPDTWVQDVDLDGPTLCAAVALPEWDILEAGVVAFDTFGGGVQYRCQWNSQMPTYRPRVQVAGDAAYLIPGYATPMAVGIGTPVADLQEVVDVGEGVYDAVFDGSLLWMTTESGLSAYDPAGPAVVGHVDFSPAGSRLSLDDGRIVVASARDGIHLVDIDGPAYLSRYLLPTDPSAVLVRGPLAFVAESSALLSVDLASPFDPRVADRVDIAVRGICGGEDGRLYVVGEGFAGRVDYLPNGYLTLHGGVALEGTAYEAQESDGLLYVSEYGLGLRILDVAGDGPMETVGVLPIEGQDSYQRELAVHGHHVYMAKFNVGIRIIDATDPTLPEQVQLMTFSSNIADLAVAHDRLYVAAAVGGLQIFDLADPAHPALLGSVNPGTVLEVLPQGKLAHLSRGTSLGLAGLDDPSAPVILDQVVTPGFVQTLGAEGALVAAGVGDHGLYLYGVDPAVDAPATRATGPALRAYPNPAAGPTTLWLRPGPSGPVQARIFDARGRRVRSLAATAAEGRPLVLRWDGRDDTGRPVARGVYQVQMRRAGETFSTRLAWIR